MEITDIRIRRVGAEGKLKAYVTVTFDDCFVVHNVKIIEGKNGAFIAMPSRKTKKGEYKDVAHPINSDFRGTLQNRILEEYERQVEEGIGEEENGNEEMGAVSQ
jgi:stage V sporulation protein G